MTPYTYTSINGADQVIYNNISRDVTVRSHINTGGFEEHTNSVAIDVSGPNGLLLLYQFRDAIEQAFKHRLSE